MDDWKVFSGVYEPREDSQLLVRVLEEQDFSGKTVLDLGTGTGIQAYTALKHGSDHVTAVDINRKALENARENILTDFLDERVEFVESDLFENISKQFDIILFNPPYVPGEEEIGTMEEKSWAGGKDGREVIDRFLEQVEDYLTSEGEVFLLQSSLNNNEKTLRLFEDYGFVAEIVAEEKVPWEKLVVIRAIRGSA